MRMRRFTFVQDVWSMVTNYRGKISHHKLAKNVMKIDDLNSSSASLNQAWKEAHDALYRITDEVMETMERMRT